MSKKHPFFQKIPFLFRFQKQETAAEEVPVVFTTLSVPFSGPFNRPLYFTGNPDFTAPSSDIHSHRFPGSRIFLYSSDPEHDLAAVPDALFDMLHRYFAVHSPDDVVLWKDGILSFQTLGNQHHLENSFSISDNGDSKIISFPSPAKRQRVLK